MNCVGLFLAATTTFLLLFGERITDHIRRRKTTEGPDES